MTQHRLDFERRLKKLPDISVDLWKDTELVCVFFKGKDFAHFHGEEILDLRLTPKIIREEQLDRAISALIHPNRSKNSRWIGIELKNDADVQKAVHLVKRACAETM